MVKISRIILVVTVIVGFSIALPKLYWMAFSKPDQTPFVMYSCIDNDFMILSHKPGENQWKDTKGNLFTRDESEKKLPLFYYRQLMTTNTMPDSIHGIPMDTYNINFYRSTFNIHPNELDAPVPGLYPLFEAESGRANIEMPDDFFRITWRMEFINAGTNKILEEKSRMFSAVLYNRGFAFPAKSINGIPSTRKSIDEGYLVIDSKDQLFHLKMVQGKPYVVKVDLPKGLKFKNISCVDFRDKKFYAYLFSTNNEVYILTQDEYELIKFPVSGIDPEKYQVRILGDIFHYNILVTGENFVQAFALDSDYKFVDEYRETWPSVEQTSEGKIFQVLFPWEIKMNSNKSDFSRFYFELNALFYWAVFNVILIGVQVLVVRKRKSAAKNNFIDFLIIGITGFFGFLAVNIFPNKFYD